MPCTVTAFSVKIASPGDDAMELIIAREVIYEWNASHSLEQKRVLLPLDGEGNGAAREASPGDMLIAFFSASPGNSSAPAASDTEIERQLEAGRPALVYFSEARVDLLGTHPLPTRAMDDFKKRYVAATIDSFGDEKEFCAKLTRQLEATINNHRHFKARAAVSRSRTSSRPAPTPRARRAFVRLRAGNSH